MSAPPDIDKPPQDLPPANPIRALRKSFQAVAKATRRGGNLMAARLPAPVRAALAGPVAYADMLLVDHGVFRLAYLNRHALTPRAWRSAQPAPHDIAWFARRGVRSILNLRGYRDCGAYRLEQKACRANGIEMIDFALFSRGAPAKETIRDAALLLERAAYPMLMHCKSGADRAGLMAVLYMHLKEGAPMREAVKQLSWRFGHFRDGATGVLDAFFDEYLAFDARTPTPFLQWVDQHYDPEALKRSFRPTGLGSLLVDRILRRE